VSPDEQAAPPAGTAGGAGPPNQETSALGRAALDKSLVRGIAWTGAVRWFTQVLSWASTLIVARLLTPTDFGLVGMATVYLGLVQLVNEFGIGSAVVLVREMPEERRAGLGGLAVGLGFVFFAISAVAAHPIALFFKEPAVRNIIIALATTFIIAGFRVLPYALLARDLEFRRMSRIDGFEATLQALATVIFAAAGYRYWSLVLGSVVASLTSAALSLTARPHRIGWPRDVRIMFEPMTLGYQVTVSRVAWYLYSNADFTIVGRVLGSRALGEYSLGWQLASIPVDKVSAVLGRVTLPVFARVQDDLVELRRYVKGLSQGIGLVTFPLSIGMALVANHFVLLLIGSHWREAILPLRLLSLYAGFRSLTTLFPQILISTGHARRAMWISITLALVLPLAFLAGTHWGTAGVAVAWMVAYPLLVIPLLVAHTLRIIGLSGREYVGALWPAISATLVMTTVVLLLSWAIPARWGDATALIAEVGVGAGAYLGTLGLFHTSYLHGFVELLRGLRK
jgi:O-antigen/teichoic acid export membrane protein